MAGRPLSEIRRAAAQARMKKDPPKAEAVETIPADRVEVVKTVEPVVEAAAEPKWEESGRPEETRSLGEILADAKMRAAKGEENEDILAMVKSLKLMLSDEK